MEQKQIIDILQQQYSYLKSTYGLKKIGIFGSYAKSRSNEKSDIDIVAEFDMPIGLRFMEFTDYLEKILGKPVDVLTPAGIKEIRNNQIVKEIQDKIIYVRQ